MSASKKKDQPGFKEIRNSKASHKYLIGDKFEAGIVLKGTEVKSIRQGKAQISEAFVRIEKGNVILYNAHIEEYSHGNIENHAPTRPRRLLLHNKEIEKIQTAVDLEAQAIIPLRMYLKHGLIKIEIALCKGKKLFDKREALKKKTDLREAERSIKQNYRR